MKFKQFGGTPQTVAFDSKDTLIYFKCGDKRKGHPSYLTTPFDITQGKGLECPLCAGKEPLVAYRTRFYDGKKLRENQKFQYYMKDGATTTLEEAIQEVYAVFDIIKGLHKDALNEGLVVLSDKSCECGEPMICMGNGDVELLGRMEGRYKGGEFFIEMIKA